MANNYITLVNYNTTLSKYFRVLQDGYDDGTLNRMENLSRTIGGGFDHAIGAVYRTWSPIIRVRHTEPISGYGTLAELETFYRYNSPTNNVITFIDHHGTSYLTHMVGSMMKQCMGCQIEGSQAWFLYKLQLMEIE